MFAHIYDARGSARSIGAEANPPNGVDHPPAICHRRADGSVGQVSSGQIGGRATDAHVRCGSTGRHVRRPKPTRGRGVTDLITVSGAAVQVPNSVIATMVTGVNISVAGGQRFGVQYLLDGAMNNNRWFDGNMPMPFPDALAEFRVSTSAQEAQIGRSSGATVNAVTKVGDEPASRHCLLVRPRHAASTRGRRATRSAIR